MSLRSKRQVIQVAPQPDTVMREIRWNRIELTARLSITSSKPTQPEKKTR
jgi:hypothetical protein